jgi:hypothetical protein
MRLVFIAISLIVGAIVGLAVLIVLAGAVAALFAHWRRGKDALAIDRFAFYLIGAAGLVVTVVTLLVALCWDGIRGKPPPPPPRYGSGA